MTNFIFPSFKNFTIFHIFLFFLFIFKKILLPFFFQSLNFRRYFLAKKKKKEMYFSDRKNKNNFCYLISLNWINLKTDRKYLTISLFSSRDLSFVSSSDVWISSSSSSSKVLISGVISCLKRNLLFIKNKNNISYLISLNWIILKINIKYLTSSLFSS